ncbi:unnamed protein product [Rhizoctonia solani]|nr:unnamed protein product [Rhizoctonia solani]
MKVEVVKDAEMGPVRDVLAEDAPIKVIQEKGQCASPVQAKDGDLVEALGPQTDLFDLSFSIRSQHPELRLDSTGPTLSHLFGPDSSLFDLWEEFTHPDVQDVRDAQTKSRSGKRSIDIEDCLDEFTKEEQVGEEDLWYCLRCKKHQRRPRSSRYDRSPIFVLHLKRFSNARATPNKIDALVELPINELNPNKRVGERAELGECVYDMFAVDEHMRGLGAGHYRAYVKNLSDNEWCHRSYVTKLSAEDSVDANAYLLFYRRRASNTKTVVRARVVSNTVPESHKAINMVEESVVHLPDETGPPPFELSYFRSITIT